MCFDTEKYRAVEIYDLFQQQIGLAVEGLMKTSCHTWLCSRYYPFLSDMIRFHVNRFLNFKNLNF